MKLSKPKHTPGPWTVDRPSAPKYATGINADGFQVVLWLPDPEKSSKTREELDANARLIAAAPEMLEALELVYRDLIANGENADAEQLTVVKTAIRKAKGE